MHAEDCWSVQLGFSSNQISEVKQAGTEQAEVVWLAAVVII